MNLLAAGSTCRAHSSSRSTGPQGHERREWHIGPDRILRWDCGETPPIPGQAEPVTVDPWRGRIGLRDGTRWWLDRRGASPRWRPETPILPEDKMHEKIVGSCSASCTQDAFWIEDRHVYIVNRESTGFGGLLTPAPVPGASPIVRVTLGPSTVTLENGQRFMLSGSVWIAMPSLVPAETGTETAARTLHLRALRGFTIRSGEGVSRGDLFDLAEADALALVRSGRAELVTEPAA